MEKPVSQKLRHPLIRFARWLIINLVVTVILLVVLEGVASFIMAHRLIEPEEEKVAQRIVAERQHTEYDPLLGWINLPGVVISNMYGAGRHLSINQLRFRDTEPINLAQPTGQLRMIISGDSFTFGYGVDDQHTWGELLEGLAVDLEVINMGMGGYGLDQAFLWYQRDGTALPHDLHLMAFITEDFNRMARDRFMGYGKPVLTSSNGTLVVQNVPPPRPRPFAWPKRFQKAIADLDIFRLLGGTHTDETVTHQSGNKLEEAILLTFAELSRLHAEAGRVGAFVYLPVQKDFNGGASNGWRKWLASESAKRGWIFIDLVRELRTLPADQIAGLFIQEDHGLFRGSAGHYTEAGNAWVAATLHRHLMAHPELSGRLNAAAQR